ncbi:MAG: molybdate ABC transporter substrate-binding protein [Solirubrobacteraceae bacterium]
MGAVCRMSRAGQKGGMPRIVVVAVALVLVLSGCSGSTDGPTLTVFAAASLQTAFNRYAGRFHGAAIHYAFAGSDVLAAQIGQGVRPDVFASANTGLPERLYAKGLVQRPQVFTANTLVLAVPAASRSITSLADIERPGVTLAVGEPEVPIGAYTRKLLDRLPATARRAVLANAKDTEPDVSGIVGKLAEGAVDAGFLYATDVRAAGGRLRAIELPADLRPRVSYAVAIVKGTAHPEQARRFIAGLLAGAGRSALLAAGFLP